MLRYEEGLKWSLPISQGVVPNGTAELTVKSGSLEGLGVIRQFGRTGSNQAVWKDWERR